MRETWIPADHGDDNTALRKRVSQGVSWTFIQAWSRQGLNFIVFVFLARLLTPVDFGLVALAAVFVTLAQLVVDQGLGDALIQRRELTRSHIDTAFWVAVITGSALTLAGVLLAGPIAGVLNEPDLSPILKVLSLTFTLSALNSIQIALLRRELAFRSLALRTMVAVAGGGAVGIGMALAGAGAWALVGQQVANAALSVLILWRVSPWRPGLRVSRENFGQLFAFGINVVGSDVLNFVSRNSDNLLIGAFLGTSPLGFYAVGYRVLDTSQSLLVNVARRITFPAFSRMQHERDRLRRAYFRMVRVTGAVTIPGYAGLVIVAPELVVVFFGHRWAASGPVAAVLFLSGPMLALQAFGEALLNAVGQPNVVLRFRFITSVANVAGFLIAVPFGIVAVAAAFSARSYVLMPLLVRWMQVYADVGPREHFFQLRGILLSTIAMAVVMFGVRIVLADTVSAFVLLAASGVAAAVTLLTALWFVDRGVLRDLLDVARHALPGVARLERRMTGRVRSAK